MYIDNSNEGYTKEANRIINLLKNDFILPTGEFCLERTGGQIFPHHIFPDLGDFLPFFMYFGEATFINRQITLYKKVLQDGILVSEFPSFHITNLAKSYEYSDLLFGLFDYYTYTKDENTKKLLLDTADTAIKIFKFDKNIQSLYYPKLKIQLPIIDTRDGTFIEFYIDLYLLTGNRKYQSIANNIYAHLINSNYYKNNGLLPTFDATTGLRFIFKLIKTNKFSSAIICKNNTNSLFGFLSLYSCIKDEKILDTIEKIIYSIQDKALISSGGILPSYSEEVTEKSATLTASFPMIDFLCDLYKEVGKPEYLNFAQNIANFWIGLQGKTGLFPLHNNGKESFLDSETDMCVALLKLYEITGNEEYKLSSDKCFDGILKYHSVHDYVLGVNIDTGEVVNVTQRTKFIALFLKLLILKIELINGKKIYEDIKLWGLLKDR